jgi:uncharacterized protein HemX
MLQITQFGVIFNRSISKIGSEVPTPPIFVPSYVQRSSSHASTATRLLLPWLIAVVVALGVGLVFVVEDEAEEVKDGERR